MNDEVIRDIAAATAPLPNKAAWAAIEPALAAAGVARREWMRVRTAVWAERLRQKPSKK